MASDLTASFEKLADTDTMQDIATLGGAYMAAVILKNTIDGRMSIDVPDEAYGIAVAGGANYAASGETAKFGMLGGGLYTLDALARRVGIKAKLQNAGGN
ncbi:hypothetical protein [Haladaptatus sp. DYF46]|uniref:hypothetical protein n=1 Tax=Haladaptatus sp. DYF46 TaxID=2886041 RepID=UPI001E5E3AA9|nr:hypothetical protein [Haladaptatus sp. DYF46]